MQGILQGCLLALCVIVTLSGCQRDKVKPLPVPNPKHVRPQPAEPQNGRPVADHPATIDNALKGRTRAALTVKVKRAISDGYLSWIEIVDDSQSAWAVVPPLEATPTGEVTLQGWVLGTARGAPIDVGPNVLWVAQIEGSSVRRRESGEEAVIDPVFAAMEVTGSVAHSAPPTIEKAEYTVAQIIKDRRALRARRVQIRGQIVHVIADLGGRDWWLLRDGLQRPAPSRPAVLFVQAQGHQSLGEVVFVEGLVETDKRFRMTTPIPVLLVQTKLLEAPPAQGAPRVEADVAPLANQNP
ncbi:MAG TPA: hypothetical protein DCQ06_02305 [Myxococcales bacterium]|nr:hypothetical protein [Myxococcales bacterium]HAN30407.1 hypothetical protein [Myxococcales bacterium]